MSVSLASLQAYHREAVQQLEWELAQLGERVREAEAAPVEVTASIALGRQQLGRARGGVAGRDLCPRCWIWDGERRRLKSSGRRGQPNYRCLRCDVELQAQPLH